MKGSVIISQGAYGCVFFPYFNCKGEKSNEYISKIQIANFTAKNEIYIGKLIQKIKTFQDSPFFYNRYFAPVLKHCDINISKIGNPEKKKCKVIQENKDEGFVLLKIPYITYDNTFSNYSDFLLSSIKAWKKVSLIFYGYTHLLEAIDVLNTNNICHFDLHSKNIVVCGDCGRTPIIIDFGLSIPMHKIKYIEDYFYVYAPDYYIWPLEVHYICLLLHENSNPTHDDLRDLCHTYVHSNKYLTRSFSPSFVKEYERMCLEMLEEYASKNIDPLKYWKTWDNYALSIEYLKLLYYLNLDGYTDNLFVLAFSQILIMNIHPNPNRRMTIHETREKFDNMLIENYQINDYEELIQNFIYTKKDIDKMIGRDQQNFNILLKKTIKY